MRVPARALPLALALFAAAAAGAELPLPEPRLEGLEPGVRERLETARESLLAALADPELQTGERARFYGETGKVFHAQHAFSVAEACYRNAAELAPEQSEWPYLLGFLAQDSGRFAEAREHYRRVLELAPENRFARLRLGQVHLELAELEDAAALFELLTDDPDLGASAHAGLGRIAVAAERFAEAAARYEQALAIDPEASRLRSALGLVYRNLGELDRARAELAQAGNVPVRLFDPALRDIGKRSVSSEMFLTTAAQALKAGRLDDAERAYRGAIAVNPDNPRAHVNLAEVLAQRGRLGEAETSAHAALELAPESFFARLTLAGIAERRGELDAAAALYEQALERDPAHVRGNFRFAALLMRRGEYERAVERYRAVVAAAPAFVRARYLQALALVALERPDEARVVLDAALAVEPEQPEIRGALARLLATSPSPASGDGERALELARSLYGENRGAEELETLAMALAAAGRHAEAVAVQETLLEALGGEAPAAVRRHLEHNLERYRAGEASDRPWPASEPAGGG